MTFEQEEVLRETMEFIREQREEILTAFIAQYGCRPDEVEQVIQYFPQSIVYRVGKKE